MRRQVDRTRWLVLLLVSGVVAGRSRARGRTGRRCLPAASEVGDSAAADSRTAGQDGKRGPDGRSAAVAGAGHTGRG